MASVHVRTDTGATARLVSDSVRVVRNTDYLALDNKPSIEGVELVGDRELEDFGTYAFGQFYRDKLDGIGRITNAELDQLLT